MEKVFYLFSESKKLEALYLCEDENYIDKPKLKTGVYPMGTLLSRAVYLLSPWYAENLNLAKKDKIMAIALSTSPNYESSFSSVVYEDSVAKIVFEMLIKNQEYKSINGKFNKSNTELKGILDYTIRLQGNIYESTTDNLRKELNELGNISLKHNIYYSKSENVATTNKKIFNPNTVRKNKLLFKLDEPQKIENRYGELNLPIHLYEIYDVVDLIVSSLQCIFEQNYILGKCKFCDSLFIGKDRRTKYCPNRLENIKSCQEIKKLNNQLNSEKSSESKKVHKNIRTQLANKLGTEDERYKRFLADSKKYRHKISNEKALEVEYIEWMKQYWEDIKAEEKKRKKQSKK